MAAAQINNVKTEHNVYQNGRKGMKVHVNFNVKNHQGSPLRVAAYFRWQSGHPLGDENGAYRAVDGQVATGEVVTPGYESTNFNDFVLFLPYEELDIKQPGIHWLKYRVRLYSMKSNSFIEAFHRPIEFEYSLDPLKNLFSSRIDN
jgi:hypothetical protein